MTNQYWLRKGKEIYTPVLYNIILYTILYNIGVYHIIIAQNCINRPGMGIWYGQMKYMNEPNEV